MLISVPELQAVGVNPSHVLHIGAHLAEEKPAYAEAGWRVTWVESQRSIVDQLIDAGLDAICATIWDTRTTLPFYVTSNGQSSSVLPLGSHLEHYPNITVTKTLIVDTCTVDDLRLRPDMLNLDIQGAELRALQGASETLGSVQWIYTEISVEELYESQVLEPELTEWLGRRGFTQQLRSLTEHGWGDALYRRT